jgi:hypothetical protein
MSTALSGINANVFSGAVDLDASGWTADYEVATFDSTTTADLGWHDETASTQKISGSFDIFYNPAKKPTGSSAGIKPGSTPNLVLWVANPGGDNYAGKALIQKLSIKTKTAEGITVTCTFINKGPWTVPT